MLDYRTSCALALEELDAFADRFWSLGASERSLPTRLEGWTVNHLARHVASAAWIQGEAFHRTRLGYTHAPEFVTLAPEEVPPAQAISVGRSHLEAGLTSVPADADPLVPLPFATLPSSFAIQALFIEYGTHRNDLEWALGEEAPLRDEMAAVQVELLPGFLPIVATAVDGVPEGTGYRLVADSGVTSVVYRNGAWEQGDGDPGLVCEIKGSDSAVSLLALGRIPAGHPLLTVEDPAGVADRFKECFPGP